VSAVKIMTREADTARHLRPANFPELSIGEYLPGGSRPGPADGARQGAAVSAAALKNALLRLEEAIDQETEALVSLRAADIQLFNQRKSRSLLELTRLSRNVPDNAEDQDLRNIFGRLRYKLQRNHTVLNLHLTASREIADLLANVLAESESDGTYGMSQARAESRK
jgi:hypothetical protein